MKLKIAGLAILAIAGFIFYLMFFNPRMKVQPKILPNQAWLPQLPQGVVVINSYYEPVPSELQAMQMKNPIADTTQNIKTGRLYYGYYCAFCHGQQGQTTGPVGRSYVPAPADVTAPQVKVKPDGLLYRNMLIGPGHEPALQYIIPPGHRWYLVTYMRYLQSEAQKQPH
jgi:hypothetical protein